MKYDYRIYLTFCLALSISFLWNVDEISRGAQWAENSGDV